MDTLNIIYIPDTIRQHLVESLKYSKLEETMASLQDKISASAATGEFKAKAFYESLLESINEPEVVESKMAELSPEELDMLLNETNMYKSLGFGSPEKCVLASVSYLKEAYLKKLATTATIGFVYQMMKEYTIDEEELIEKIDQNDFMEEVDLNPDFELNYTKAYADAVLSIVEKSNPELYADYTSKGDVKIETVTETMTEDELLEAGRLAAEAVKSAKAPTRSVNQAKMYDFIHEKIKEQSAAERAVINRFLNKFFKFDPLNHTQESKTESNHDPERSDVPTDADELTKTLYETVPPNDTFCRFNTFYDINYEKLRKATEDLYGLKSDLDHAMIVYDIADSQDDAKAFVQKYGNKTKLDIVSFPLNKWTLLGPFKENRDRINFYNKNNKIIEHIIEQQEKDAALGTELLNQRIKTRKRVNEKVFGKDSKEFEQYRKMNPSDLETKYGVKMEELENGDIKISKTDVVDVETGKVLEVDEEGCPTDGLEVGVVKINAATGETSTSTLYTKSEERIKRDGAN